MYTTISFYFIAVLSSDSSEEEEQCLQEDTEQEKEIVEQENDFEDDIEEDEILRAKDNKHIYIRKVLKNNNLEGSSQPNKKLDRVYNQKHCCFLCKKMVLHLPSHFKSKHHMVPEIKEALMKTGKRRFDELRVKGDHMNNEQVLKEGKGELIISRRPKEFRVTDFGPCSICFEWMKIDYLHKHHKRAHSETSVSDSTKLQSKKVIQLNSDREVGRVNIEKQSNVVNQVLEIMTRDEVKVVAQGDELICALGESWMRRNFGNKKAKYYASQHMRLMAKFLMNLRELDCPSLGNEVQAQSLWDFLVPSKYDLVVAAAVQLAYPYMDDVDDLRSPSNAIKIKYDILKVINEKWARIQIRGNPDPEEAHKCDTFLRLMNIK